MTTPAASSGPDFRVDERVLALDFECLRSIPGGINEVRLWWDNLLSCRRVGKRLDVSGMEGDDVLPEPSTLQSINHRNVVEVMAAVNVSGYPPPMRVVELVTPYYERGSITDALLRGETFTAGQAVATTQAALRGLGHLHEVHGICHRDIKSGNILLTSDPALAKVADLGLAGRFDSQGEVVIVNNPTPYSPWEFGTTGKLTRASDLYAVGLVMRELLAGPFPYAEIRTSDIVERLAKGRPALLPEHLGLPIWASRSMLRFYRKATHRRPAARFQSAAEMDAALTRVLAIDWALTDDLRWEAPFAHQPKSIAVEGRELKRAGGYRLSVLVKGGAGWRRVWADLDVPALDSADTRNLFDQASQIAAVR